MQCKCAVADSIWDFASSGCGIGSIAHSDIDWRQMMVTIARYSWSLLVENEGKWDSHWAMNGEFGASERPVTALLAYSRLWPNACQMFLTSQQTQDVESMYVLTLVHRLRRWTKVKPTLIQCLVSAGKIKNMLLRPRVSPATLERRPVKPPLQLRWKKRGKETPWEN